MILALAMRDKVVIAFEPFSAFDAVELPETWQILDSFGGLESGEVFGRCEVSANLVVIPLQVSLFNPRPDEESDFGECSTNLVRRLVLMRFVAPMAAVSAHQSPL